MEHVTFTRRLQRHRLMATPSELPFSWVSLLVKGLMAQEAVMETRGVADVCLLWLLWCQSQHGRNKFSLRPSPM
ncbi:hypothetical protein J1605_007615 [Eschrichtius robustus]|uniref:Uncharacterized protein n=1 Tax=Eschrichtius robustus TaxID=9764 RepID=A0AB34H2Y5_ESCRO|nr:hypothetical protein J1605_007615 [Eschrichtius robustus]